MQHIRKVAHCGRRAANMSESYPIDDVDCSELLAQATFGRVQFLAVTRAKEYRQTWACDLISIKFVTVWLE